MDRITRKDLKTDKFAVEVTHTVEYLGEHRSSLYRYGAIILAVLLVGGGVYFYMRSQHDARQQALADALQAQNAPASPVGNPFIKSFNSQAEKDAAVDKAFSDIVAKYGGSDEAAIANYMLGTYAADKGKMADAEKRFKAAAESGKSGYASLAKLALSDIYVSEGKAAEAEKLLRDIVANPSILVSKEQATIALARIVGQKNPAEAQKLLEPLRTVSGATGQAAMNAITEITAKK